MRNRLLDRLKPILHQSPLVGPVLREAARQYRSWTHRRMTTEDTFTEIYRSNAWDGTDSVSGRGSNAEQTARLVSELPGLLRDLQVTSLLDIPCGDFFWMKQVDLAGIQYTGADIVPELVEKNRQYETRNIRFQVLDLLTSGLPQADLVLSRDCFIHLSHADVFRALNNLLRSGSEYLLTTTFPEHRRNRDICTGQFRILNLELEPYRFPPPLRLIEEGCTETNELADKSLGLWRIAELQPILARRQTLAGLYQGLRGK
jgi:SAM-dependent methyltransferase